MPAAPAPTSSAPASAPLVPAPAPAAPAVMSPAPAAPAAKTPAPAPSPAAKAPTLIASVPTAPEASTPAAPETKSPAAPASQPTASLKTPAAPSTPAAATLHFALEFGPLAAADAERVERQLTQAGYPTVRLRQPQTGAAAYAVLLERIPGAAEAQALVGTLREQGYGEATVTRQDPPVVRVGEPLPLRRAVELAERLKAGGYQVRVAAQSGAATGVRIRHGSFPSKPEAEARAEELGRLGLTPQVVQVR